MTDFTLYGFAESGNAHKVALMLELCGAAWRCQPVEFFTGETRRPEFRQVNVMGEVPVLIHHRADGDFTLTQSGACLTYLSRHLHAYGPENESEDYDIMRWLLFDSQKISGSVAIVRFQRHMLKRGETETVQFLHSRMMSGLKVLNAGLEGRRFIIGERPTIADFALQGYLHWPDEAGFDCDRLPNIPPWLDRIRALPGFKTAEELMPSARPFETATA